MKKILGLALSFAICFSLIACKDPFKEDVLQEGKFNVTVGYLAEDGEDTVIKELEKAYELKNPNVNIIVKDFGGDTFTSFMTKNASNQDSLPDVMWMPDDEFAGFAEGGYFLDLRSYYEKSAETDYSLYYESMLHSASYSGEYKPLSVSKDKKHALFYAPRDYNKIAIVINTKLFNDFDVAIPNVSEGWDLDALFDLCKEINDKIVVAGRKYQGYNAISLQTKWEPVYTTIFNELGSDGLIKSNGETPQLVLGNEENLQIVDKLYTDLFQYSNTVDRVGGGFINGTVFMHVISRPVCVGISRQVKTVDFIPFPAENVGAGNSGYGIVAKKATATQTVGGVTKTVGDLAWDFIKYIISEEGQEVAGKTGLSVPVLKSLKDTGAWRKAIGEDLNHSSFLAGGELRLSTFSSVAPQKRTALRSVISNFFAELERPEGGSPENRGDLLDRTIRAFNQNS